MNNNSGSSKLRNILSILASICTISGVTLGSVALIPMLKEKFSEKGSKVVFEKETTSPQDEKDETVVAATTKKTAEAEGEPGDDSQSSITQINIDLSGKLLYIIK